MAPRVDKQSESQLSVKIKELLILLRGDFGFSNRDIALKVGVGENYLSNVFNGGKAGSPQLLAGLELLKELTILKSSGVVANPNFVQEIEVMKRRLAEMERMVGSKYPEHEPRNLAVNEEKDKPNSGSKTALKVTKMAADSAKNQKHDPEK